VFCHYRNQLLHFASLAWLLLALAPGTGACHDENNGALLVLPALDYMRSEPGPEGGGNKTDTMASLDVSYALQRGGFRLFSEFVITDTDNNFSSDLSRLHIGWESTGGTTIWAGRFQTNQGYWNKTFHFRNYIQPAILPPGIAAYEKEGGVLPTHFSGIATRHQWTMKQNATLQLEAGFGTGDKFRGRLRPHDLLDPDGGRKPAASLRLSYVPDQDNDNEIGLFYAASRIPMKNTPYAQNNQQLAGAYLNWHFGRTRLIGTLYRIGNDLKTASGRDHNRFTTGYLQGQYRFGENWLPYLRIENSHGEKDDPYMTLFPKFVRKRTLAGIRWNFAGNQALKLEYADTDFLNRNANQLAAQWSMILP